VPATVLEGPYPVKATNDGIRAEGEREWLQLWWGSREALQQLRDVLRGDCAGRACAKASPASPSATRREDVEGWDAPKAKTSTIAFAHARGLELVGGDVEHRLECAEHLVSRLADGRGVGAAREERDVQFLGESDRLQLQTPWSAVQLCATRRRTPVRRPPVKANRATCCGRTWMNSGSSSLKCERTFSIHWRNSGPVMLPFSCSATVEGWNSPAPFSFTSKNTSGRPDTAPSFKLRLDSIFACVA
jgi:hypothetical protein